jgi:hypothetical protein
MPDIKLSVGKHGTNNSADVVVVQILLNKFILAGRLALAVLVPDGSCGKRTKAAIKVFQSVFLGHKEPDGRVDPGGKTLIALNGSINQPQLGDPNEQTRQAVLEILKSLPSFSFTLGEMKIEKADLEEIGRIVEERRIDIVHEPWLGESAAYEHSPNVMKLGFQKASTALRRSVIVHESVHAILDKRGQMETMRNSEAASFIAQATYYYAQNKRHINEVGPAAMGSLFMHAGNMAINILKNQPYRPEDLQGVYNMMSQIPGYDNASVFAYDGIP